MERGHHARGIFGGGSRPLGLVSWLVGAAALATVIVVGLHFSEQREFLRLADHAEPWWLALAAALQVATYYAEGEVWQVVLRRAGATVSRAATCKLSVAKLFIDQALPSGGISGTFVFARALEDRGASRKVVMAAVIVGTVSYHAVYVLTLAVALAIAKLEGWTSTVVVVTSGVFAVFAIVLTVGALAVSGREFRVPAWFDRFAAVRGALSLLRDADPALARRPGLLFAASAYQAAIVLLDAATLWFLVRSVGASAPPLGVFSSFVVSSLFRTVGIIPGGLGTFEAASVVTLRMTGVSVAVALSATLLFRGLSFWLPLVPGLVFSSHAARAPRVASAVDACEPNAGRAATKNCRDLRRRRAGPDEESGSGHAC
jgi:Mg2+-importing ATPase